MLRLVACPVVVVGLLAPVSVALAGPASAASVRNVPADYATIQAAIDASSSGDTVLVQPGTYAERIDFNRKNVVVRSAKGPASTTINGQNAGTTVTIGPLGTLNGFTVTGGSYSFGAGMVAVGGGSLVTGNIFRNNSQGGGGFGAAIGGNGASPTITANLFEGNSCDGQFLSGVVAFVNSSSPLIDDNVFRNNPCRAINMTLPEGNAPRVLNNVMVGNPVGIRVDARVKTSAQVYRNNLLVGNTIGLHLEFSSAANEPTFDHNDVFGNGTNYQGGSDKTGTSGNISADPLFKDQSGGDFHLFTGSPAVDVGSDVGVPSADFDGTPRPIDGDGDGTAVTDMGAFEAQPSDAPHFSVTNESIVEGDTGTKTLVFTASLDRPADQGISVPFATADRTATAPADYVARSGFVSFEPGEQTRPLSITINSDRLDEVLEKFVLNFSSAANVLLDDNKAAGKIIDDDRKPRLTVNDVTIAEGDFGTRNVAFTVALSAPSGKTVMVAYKTVDGTATSADYESGAGTITFKPGDTTVLIEIPIIGDAIDEPDETFSVVVSSPIACHVTDDTGIASIIDDDPTPDG